MSKLSLLFLVLLYSYCYSIMEETASFKDFLYGITDSCAYTNWVSHVSEGIADDGFNIYAPYDQQTNGFGDFRSLSSAELDLWENVVNSFVEGEFENTQDLLDLYEFPYQVIEFYDLDTDRTYYILREVLNYDYYDDNGTTLVEDDEVGSFDLGWGLFVHNPASSKPVIVNVVHPNDDFISIPVACRCFQDWDAKFLLIAGAGREVEWTELGSYSNNKSLSDPSRNSQHAFNRAYQILCDKIRNEFNRREFSIQLHSYDWNRHEDHANCQISAGANKDCPNLPIRDLSDLKLDVINNSDLLIHESNSIGNNEAVFLNDFYAVNYNIYEFTYSNQDTAFAVNNDVDLEGYTNNRQMFYSFNDWNQYDLIRYDTG